MNLLAYFKSKVDLLFANKVDKVEGKGLSDTNYTQEEKAKLANVASGAQVNALEGIQKNGVAVAVTNKIANISVPVATSEITNDSGFITSEDVPIASSTVPVADGVAFTGSENGFARGDHVHPTDTSRAPIASPSFTGTPIAPTPTAGDNSTQIATTAFVNTAISGKADANSVYTKTEIDNMITSTFKPGGSVAFANLPALTAVNLGKVVNVTNSFTTTADFIEGAGKSFPAGTNVAIVDVGSAGSPSYKYDASSGFIDLSGYVEESEISLATNDDIDAMFT